YRKQLREGRGRVLCAARLPGERAGPTSRVRIPPRHGQGGPRGVGPKGAARRGCQERPRGQLVTENRAAPRAAHHLRGIATGDSARERKHAMAVVTMRQLLESGVHFGHQTRRWNPKMKRFIVTERNGIYIIDLQQSLEEIDRAYDFVKSTVSRGGSILFVGTKKQAQEAVAEQ